MTYDLDKLSSELSERFTLKECIEDNSLFSVFSGISKSTDAEVLISVLNDDIIDEPKIVDNLEKNIDTSMAISHRNIQKVIGPLVRDSTTYFVSESLPQDNLLRKLKSTDYDLGGSVKDYLLKLAEMLEYLHSKEIVHLGININNIYDYGTSNPILANTPITSALSGSSLLIASEPYLLPAYLSPEQIMGKKGGITSDVYSFGVLAFELLTGKMPYKGTDIMEIAQSQLSDEVEIPNDLSEGNEALLKKVVLKCLNRDTELRFQSVSELIEEINNITNAISSESNEESKLNSESQRQDKSESDDIQNDTAHTFRSKVEEIKSMKGGKYSQIMSRGMVILFVGVLALFIGIILISKSGDTPTQHNNGVTSTHDNNTKKTKNISKDDEYIKKRIDEIGSTFGMSSSTISSAKRSIDCSESDKREFIELLQTEPGDMKRFRSGWREWKLFGHEKDKVPGCTSAKDFAVAVADTI